MTDRQQIRNIYRYIIDLGPENLLRHLFHLRKQIESTSEQIRCKKIYKIGDYMSLFQVHYMKKDEKGDDYATKF